MKTATRSSEFVDGDQTIGIYTAFGYRSVRVANRDGRRPSIGGGKSHEDPSREQLLAQSREFMRDNGTYAGMIRRAVSFIVGEGWKLQCTTGSTRWNKDVEARWKEFWLSPEVSGLKSGHQCERMVASETLVCGEHFVVLTNRGKIQLVEAEQVRGATSSTRGDDGITRDPVTDEPISYRIVPYDASGGYDQTKSRDLDAKQVLYISEPDRPSSSRAVPPSQAAFPMFHRMDDVCNSEAVAWQMQSKLALSVTRKDGFPEADSVSSADEGIDGTGSPAGNRVTYLPNAMIFHGAEGEEIRGIERTAPAKNFRETLSMFFRLMGLPIGLPLEMTLLDWTQSNYSQSRAVLEQVKVSLLAWMGLLEMAFYRRVFKWWLEIEIAAGRIKPRADQFSHEWIKPSIPWIDQLAEAQAHGERVDRGFETFDDVCKSLNRDSETQREKIVAEITAACTDAAALKKAFPEQEFPWEILAGRKAPEKPVPPATQKQPQKVVAP